MLGFGVVDNIVISNQTTTPTPENCGIFEFSKPLPIVAETMLCVHQTPFIYQGGRQEDHFFQKLLQLGGANDWILSRKM